jgi:signal transduction histidine kinase
VQIAAVHNEQGELDSLLVTVLDVSDRRKIEAELLRQFSFLRALLDTIPNPIFYRGADTRLLGCNLAYENFLASIAAIHRQARPRLSARGNRPGLPGRGRTDHCRGVQYQPRDATDRRPWPGARHPLLGQRFPGTAWPAGRPDRRHRRHLAAQGSGTEAERARAAAESAAAAKADFLANMSHEIRTPMNAIIGMTHLALQTELNDRQRNYLRKVDNAAKGLLGIINDILDLSKIEAGMMHFEQTPFSLDAILLHLSDLCAIKARERGLELLYDIAPDVPDQLVGDPLRLGQVLLNLVGNAIKFTEPAKSPSPSGDCARVRALSNSLRGYRHRHRHDAEQQERLFAAFTQADTSTTRKYGGTGLGLSICKRIVDLQGGSISVSSQPGIGSRFTFHLPFGLAAGKPWCRAASACPTTCAPSSSMTAAVPAKSSCTC